MASGVMLLLLHRCVCDDRQGDRRPRRTVREIGLFSTESVTENGNILSIPNATILTGTIVVYRAREATRRTDFTCHRGGPVAEDIDAVQKDACWSAWAASRAC